MELTENEILSKKIPTLSVSEYSAKYHPGLTNAALNYAMQRGDVDYVKRGRFRYIALTANTADYVPRADKTRPGR